MLYTSLTVIYIYIYIVLLVLLLILLSLSLLLLLVNLQSILAMMLFATRTVQLVKYVRLEFANVMELYVNLEKFATTEIAVSTEIKYS